MKVAAFLLDRDHITDMNSILLFTILGYLAGGIPFSYLVGWLFTRKDIRSIGDGNPGGTNVIKAGGVIIGLVAIALDIGKGFLPVYLAGQQGINSGWGMIPVVLAPIIGHATQPFLKSRGGKALGTAGGAWAGVIGLWVFLDFTVLAMLSLVFIKDHAWASIIGSLSLILWAVFVDGSVWMIVLSVLTVLLLTWTHRRELVKAPELRPWISKQFRKVSYRLSR
jgi:acyl phosphate:glycerol-3-phosphate acyltransferase